MKTNSVLGYFLAICVSLVIFSVASCKKDEKSWGIPKSTRISTSKDLTTTLINGNMGDWIALHGTNLEAIQSIHFNDIAVDLEEYYYENDVLYVQVPVKMPGNVTNKIIVKTKGGEATYDFTIKVPDLEMTGIFNEYTLPGDTIMIYGKFLKLYGVNSSTTSVSFGGVETPVIEATDTYLTAKVPLNVQSNVKVEVINKKYNVKAVSPGYYQDKHNVITSFDSDFPYTGSTGKKWVGEWANPKPTSNKYIRFEVEQSTYPNGLGWFYLFECNYNYTLDMISHPENYVLKYELNMGMPIKTTKFFLYYYWAVGPKALGGETFNVQTLGKWQTVSIPLDKIIPVGNTGTSTNFSLNMRIENFSPVERVAMYFDNFRIYKKGE